MKNIEQYLHYVSFFMIGIAILLLVIIVLKNIIRIAKIHKYKKIKNKELERNRVADIVFAQSSVASTEILRKSFYCIIHDYIIVENDTTAPITNTICNEISNNLITELCNKRQRFAETNYLEKIINLVLNKHLYIVQYNDNGYQNSKIIARARYDITIEKRHSTFNTIESYSKETYYLFEKTENSNWKLIEIKEDKILKQNGDNSQKSYL